nr:Acyl-coenzyme A oxidase [Ipomoea batatas]
MMVVRMKMERVTVFSSCSAASVPCLLQARTTEAAFVVRRRSRLQCRLSPVPRPPLREIQQTLWLGLRLDLRFGFWSSSFHGCAEIPRSASLTRCLSPSFAVSRVDRYSVVLIEIVESTYCHCIIPDFIAFFIFWKWWPGGLDKSAIPIVVFACLITEGFIVQLRSLEDNKPLPGITVLEILE